jgi:hypothetical protein
MADICANMFTEGESKNGDAGFKVLTDRIRRGVEALKEFDYTDEDPLIAAANNAISDDENIVDQIKKALTLKVYEGMKDPEAFFPVLDVEEDELGELVEVKKDYDMSVFIKNPNMYSMLPKNGFSEENMPGWVVTKGNPGFWGTGGDSWGNPRNIEGLPEDIAVTVYHAEAQVEQTITDLPAGVYTVKFRGWDNSDTSDGTYAYVKTSETPAVEEGAELDRDVNYAAYLDMESKNIPTDGIQNIVVTDGVLTLGFAWGSNSQAFFEYVNVLMTAPANVDYAALYADAAAAGIETLEGTPAAKVRAIQLFDINGRRVMKAQKGITIVKKVMSDGSIKTEKVIVK